MQRDFVFISRLKFAPRCFATKIATIFLLFACQATFAATLAVVNKSSNTVSIFDEATLNPIVELQVGNKPHEAVLSPDKKTLLISNYGSKFKAGSTLTVIDLSGATPSIFRTIQLPTKTRPHGIKFISNNEAVVVCEDIQTLLKVNTLRGIIDRSIALPGKGAHMVAVDADQHYAYVASTNSGTVAKVDLTTNIVVADQGIGKHAEGLTLAADGMWLLVGNRKQNQIAVLATQNLSIIKTIGTEYGPIRVALFNHGKNAVITNCISGTLQTIDLATLTIQHGYKTTTQYSKTKGKILGHLLSVPISIAVRDDEHTAYIANSFAGNVTLIDLNDGKILKTFEANKEPDGLALG